MMTRNDKVTEAAETAFSASLTIHHTTAGSPIDSNNEDRVNDDDDEDRKRRFTTQTKCILDLCPEILANIFSFLPPEETLQVVAAPICREWQENVTYQSELWRNLCIQDPFRAQLDEEENVCDDSSRESNNSANDSEHDDDIDDESLGTEQEMKHCFGSHRLMFCRLIRCQKFLCQIKAYAVAGRNFSVAQCVSKDSTTSSGNLENFLSRARACSSLENSLPSEPSDIANYWKRSGSDCQRGTKKIRYGASQITSRLLVSYGTTNSWNSTLPWSCAIYSIINWMKVFKNVQGIQILCLGVLPCLMEDEQQRLVGCRVGLSEIVLEAMMRFPDDVDVHTAALHTIVLLARPIGGREGQLFSSASVSSATRAVFDGHHNGIELVLDSMRRFPNHETLQAMGCWSLVNLSLDLSQKLLLIDLGGISVILSALKCHSLSTEVQFRALFSLINLVIPSQDHPVTWLHPLIDQMVDLVVTSMRNFCSNVTILNRASLVLHNLSLATDNHASLLLNADAFHLLEWCIASYPFDHILQQSAAVTLQRLQTSLSQNAHLYRRCASRHAERKVALEHELLLPDDDDDEEELCWISDDDSECEEERLIDSDV